MKICHIVSHIDEEASGPSYSVPRLCKALAELGHDVTLATLDRGCGTHDLGEVHHISFPQAPFPRRLGRSPEFKAWLLDAGRRSFQLIHSHGLWMMSNIYPAVAARRANIPHVLAPRGTLDPAALDYSRWLKKAFWHLRQGAVVHGTAALHATSEQEAQHLRAFGLRNPIILSPNGIDLPDRSRPARRQRRTLLYLGRLHEKKGLDMLLQAWVNLEPAYLEWDLRIVGKGTAEFENEIDQEIVRKGLQRVRLEGAVYGESKLAAFQGADLFVLPTRGENFGMVVAEALAAGTPVVTTTAAPWEGLISTRSGWSCAPTVDAIEATLKQAMARSTGTLEEMGARGRAWMRTAYSWDTVAARLSRAYAWLVEGGNMPEDILRG